MKAGAFLVSGVALLAAAAMAPPPAYADDAACFSASENEIGLRKQQKLRAALQQLVLCTAPSCPAEVKAECDRRVVELNAALPTIVIGATDPAGNDLSAVSVTLDGAPFASVLDGRAVPVDPGTHVLRFEAAGKPPVEKTIVAREGEKGRHINIVLGPAAVPGAAPVTSPAVMPPSTTATPAPTDLAAHGTWSTQKTVALVSAGVGVVAVGVGTAFGFVANGYASDQRANCTGLAPCTDHATALTDHSNSLAAGNVSTAMFIVGGVGVAGAITLWFTAPTGRKGGERAPAPAARLRFDPIVGPRIGGMMVGGAFE